ncbi:MAG: fumarylacetoacetate hydrolase family protein [Elusimicrobia bacterium]|nr:fumarylacetoacetate hydrolase family protein [Elusimicrobiota bacterium]
MKDEGKYKVLIMIYKFTKKPSKVVAVGLNYINHATELKMKLPDEPIIFIKPVTSVIWNNQKIKYPKMSKQVDYEAELGIVIGKQCKNISEKEAKKYILGYTCVNDVTARDLQRKDGQWTRAKSFDTFCPIGPHIVSGIANPNNLNIELFLNGELKQSSNTKNLIFKVEELVSFISKIMTLEKYDVIATGTPSGIGPVKTGDKIEVKIEKIGTLINCVE